MSQRLEVVITSSNGEGLDVYDLKAGTHFRGMNCAAEGPLASALLDDEYVCVSQKDRPGMHIYSWRTGRNELKCALQERATCLAAHPNGMYIAAGSASGKLYVWELSSGLLLRTVEAAHYKAVSALAFSQPDGQFLVSGGDDSTVNVWLTAELVALNTDLLASKSHSAAAAAAAANEPFDAGSAIEAYAVWTDHSLPVTHIHCAIGGSNGRVLSSSRDRTVKLWDLANRTLLHSFLFPASISTCVMDAAERWIFAAAATGSTATPNATTTTAASAASAATDGLIYQIDLVRGRSHSSTGSSAAAASMHAATESAATIDWFEPTVFSTSAGIAPVVTAGSGGSGSGSGSGSGVANASSNAASNAGAASAAAGSLAISGVVTALSISFNGSLLASAHSDGSARIWDTASKQPIRVLQKTRRSCDAIVITSDAIGFATAAISNPTAIAGGHKHHTLYAKSKRSFVALKKHSTFSDTLRTHHSLRISRESNAAGLTASDAFASPPVEDVPSAVNVKRLRSTPIAVASATQSVLRGFDLLQSVDSSIRPSAATDSKTPSKPPAGAAVAAADTISLTTPIAASKQHTTAADTNSTGKTKTGSGGKKRSHQ